MSWLTPATAGFLTSSSSLWTARRSKPAGTDWLGMLAAIGIVEGQPFNLDARAREILDREGTPLSRTSNYRLNLPPNPAGGELLVGHAVRSRKRLGIGERTAVPFAGFEKQPREK